MALSLPSIVLASLLYAAAGEARAARPAPVLVELFTSEGCSSCPPADAVLARLAQEQVARGWRVIALGEHVDYWDDLGWKDAFSAPLFTQRQQAYAHRFGLSGPYTPQLVVGGRLQAPGGDEPAARSAIAAAARSSDGSIALQVSQGRGADLALDIRAAWSGGAAEVVVALVEDRVTTQVTRGENAGRALVHVAAVLSMVKVGRAAGTFSARAPLDTHLLGGPAHAVVFVQEPSGGRVYAADSIVLPNSPQASAPPER